jgi:hypothetical protein
MRNIDAECECAKTWRELRYVPIPDLLPFFSPLARHAG